MLNDPTISHTAEILRPTQVEVNLSRLTANYRSLQAHVAPAAVMPIVKADASATVWSKGSGPRMKDKRFHATMSGRL